MVYYVSDKFLVAKNTAVTKTDKNCCSQEAYILVDKDFKQNVRYIRTTKKNKIGF